jgi:hypothetical protein
VPLCLCGLGPHSHVQPHTLTRFQSPIALSYEIGRLPEKATRPSKRISSSDFTFERFSRSLPVDEVKTRNHHQKAI